MMHGQNSIKIVFCVQFFYKLNSDVYPKHYYRHLFVIERYCVLFDLENGLQDLIGNMLVMKNELSYITTSLWKDFFADAVLPSFIEYELLFSCLI
jgi:hypothetical protein